MGFVIAVASLQTGRASADDYRNGHGHGYAYSGTSLKNHASQGYGAYAKSTGAYSSAAPKSNYYPSAHSSYPSNYAPKYNPQPAHNAYRPAYGHGHCR